MKINTVLKMIIILITLILCFNVLSYAAYILSATEVVYTKTDGTEISVKSALDDLYVKVPTKEIGDEVTVGGEQFYVLEWDNDSDTVNLISKYCLNPNEIKQDSGASGVSFSSTTYWTYIAGEPMIELNDYVGYSDGDVMDIVSKYGERKNAVKTRLLRLGEATELARKSKTNSKIYEMYYGTEADGGWQSYWLSNSTENGRVWRTTYGYPVNSWYRNSIGVRPVITVLKSNIT